jgi:uncharacterized protein YbjT (DUF2867 family)
MREATTLVLGGSGKTGRRVVERLRRRHVPVRVGGRFEESRFDWEDESTWPEAVRNTRAVYITYYPDLAAPGALEAIRSFTDCAVAAGVTRLVLLSGRGEPEAQRCEQAVRLSGVEWTLLRASWFSQNFSESYLLEPILAGEVALPAGNVGEPFVDVDDIADVAIAALTEDSHHGRLYELTGPRLWTFADAIAEIARATRRRVRYVQVSNEEFVSALRRADVPPAIVGLLAYLFAEVLDGRNARLTDGVADALSRPPRDFADYVRDTAKSGVWNTPAFEMSAAARGALSTVDGPFVETKEL